MLPTSHQWIARLIQKHRQARAAGHDTIRLILRTLDEYSLTEDQALSILEQTTERLQEPARMLRSRHPYVHRHQRQEEEDPSLREADTAALRRQTVIRARGLAAVGTGRCPLCHQRTGVFARRSAPPGPTKEFCLDCWKAQR